MTILEQQRSNRPLTGFVCNFLVNFLTGKYIGRGERVKGNTSVSYDVDEVNQHLVVAIFGVEIFSLAMKHWRPESISASFGNYYDVHGQPTTTTLERLNGLLNTLAMEEIIPDGVRVFRDPEQRLTYIGRGEERIAVGEKYAGHVLIQPHVNRLIMFGGELQ